MPLFLPTDIFRIKEICCAITGKPQSNIVALCGSAVDFFHLELNTKFLIDVDFLTTHPTKLNLENFEHKPADLFNEKYETFWPTSAGLRVEIFVMPSFQPGDVFFSEQIGLLIDSPRRRVQILQKILTASAQNHSQTWWLKKKARTCPNLIERYLKKFGPTVAAL